MSDIITGQIEALLPQYLAAKEAAEAAKEHQRRIAAAMAEIISGGADKTIRTEWGTVSLINGRRSVVITDRALKAQIKMLEEDAVKDGRAEERYGEKYITVRAS